MSFLKKIFKKDDDIPEMHIQKNEPKPYYSKEHNCWLIPGKEKEMIEAIQKQKKEPPKKIGSSTNNTSQVVPGVSSTNKKPKQPLNRYAMIVPVENVAEIMSQNQTENISEIKELSDNIISTTSEIKKFNQFTEEQNFDYGSQTLQTEENLIKIQTFEKCEYPNDYLSEFQKNEPNIYYNSESNIPKSNPQSVAVDYKELENKIRDRIEEEYIQKMRDQEDFFTDQLNEAREEIQFCEENYLEEISILKNQMNNFIKENLELKIESDKAKDELSFKQKEVEQYQNLLDTYRTSIEDTQDVLAVNSTAEENETNKCEDFVLIHHQVEKLEYDKLILNNELIEAKRVISTLTLDKSIMEYKLKESDESNSLSLDKYKGNIIQLEQKNFQLESQNKFLQKSKENFEKEAKEAKDLRKLNIELLENNNLLNSEVTNMKNFNEKLILDLNSQIQICSQLKNEITKFKTSLEEKDFNYSKVIRELRGKLTENKKEIESLRDKNEENKISSECLKEFQEKISELNYKIFQKDNLISEFEENVEKIKTFVFENFDFSSNPELKEININTMSKDICLILKFLLNESNSRIYEKNLKMKEIALMTEEIKNLKIEVEILKDYKKDMTLEIEKQKDLYAEANSKFSKLLIEKDDLIGKNESEISEKNYLLERIKFENKENEEKFKNSSKTYQQQLQTLQNEFNKVKENLKSSEKKLKLERSKNEILSIKNSELQEEIVELNLKHEENKFTFDFSNSKMLQELKDRDYIYENIVNELNNLIASDLFSFNSEEIQEFTSFCESNQVSFPELILSNKVRFLINLVEKSKMDFSLIKEELKLANDDLTRNVSVIELLEKKISMLNSTIYSLNSEMDELKRENKIQKDSECTVKKEIMKFKEKEKLLEEEIRKFKEKEKLLEEEIRKFKEKEKSINDGEIKKLKEKEKSLEDEIKKFLEKENSYEDEIKKFLEKEKSNEVEIINLTKKINILCQEINSVKLENNNLNNLFEDLKSEHETLKEKGASIATKYEYLERKNSEFQNEKNNLLISLKELQEENVSCKSSISSLEKHIKILTENNIHINAQMDQIKDECQRLKGNVDQKENEISLTREEAINLSLKVQEREKEIEILKEKAKKLKVLLEQTKTTYEKGLENLKIKNKQKLNEMTCAMNALEKERDELKSEFTTKLKSRETEEKQEIAKLKEQISNLSSLNKEQQDLFARLFLENSKILLKQGINLQDKNPYQDRLNSITQFINKVDLENENFKKDIKEKEFALKEKDIRLSHLSEQNQEFSKALTKLSNEKEALFESLGEKSREIDDNLSKLSDLEFQNRSLKNSYDDANKNYENLLKTHKSAEKMNELQKKLQHLIEEKSTLSQSNSLIVESLTREIKELNEKLNEYRRKERVSVGDENKERNISIETVPEKISKNDKIYVNQPLNNESSQEEISNQTGSLTQSQNQKPENKNLQQQQAAQNLGFLTRILAPIFLTEKELETIQSNKN